MIPHLNHENDGLIYTKVDNPYRVGRDDNIIKWKPPHLNTIDFLLIPNESFNVEKGDVEKGSLKNN